MKRNEKIKMICLSKDHDFINYLALLFVYERLLFPLRGLLDYPGLLFNLANEQSRVIIRITKEAGHSVIMLKIIE